MPSRQYLQVQFQHMKRCPLAHKVPTIADAQCSPHRHLKDANTASMECRCDRRRKSKLLAVIVFCAVQSIPPLGVP